MQSARRGIATVLDWPTLRPHQILFQARARNTLAFRALARSATHRHRAHRPAPSSRARAGARTATLPWWGGRGAGRGLAESVSAVKKKRQRSGSTKTNAPKMGIIWSDSHQMMQR